MGRFKAIVEKILPLVTSGKTIGLNRLYWLEALDVKHRTILYLLPMFKIWRLNNKDRNFFDWLDSHEINNPVIDKIRYVQEQRDQYTLSFSDGLIYQNQKLLDTTSMRGKYPGYAVFVIEPFSGTFYCAEYRQDEFNHSSFLNGNRVEAAGMMSVEQGKLKSIAFYSGHYANDASSITRLLSRFPIETLLNLKFVIRKLSKTDALPEVTIKNLIEARFSSARTDKSVINKFSTELVFYDDFIEKKFNKNKMFFLSHTENIMELSPILRHYKSVLAELGPIMFNMGGDCSYQAALTALSGIGTTQENAIIKSILIQILISLKSEPKVLSFDNYHRLINDSKTGSILLIILAGYFKEAVSQVEIIKISNIVISSEPLGFFLNKEFFPSIKNWTDYASLAEGIKNRELYEEDKIFGPGTLSFFSTSRANDDNPAEKLEGRPEI